MAAPHPALLQLVRTGTLPSDLSVTLPLVDSAIEHGLAPLLDEAASTEDVPGDAEALMRLAAWSMKSTAHTAETDKALAVLIETCVELGIEPVLFKGRAVAQRWYPRPELRPSYDIDIYVSPDQRNRIGDLVEALDGSSDAKDAIAHMHAEGRVFEYTASIDGIDIDIHTEPWMLLVPPRQQMVARERTETLTLPNGMSVRVPDLEMTLMIALVNGMRDNFADLLHIGDIGRMIDADPDWTFISRFAAAEGWTNMLRFGIGFVSDVLERQSPLPRELTPKGRSLIAALWPRGYLLMGAESVIRSHRRQNVLGVLVEGRTREATGALGRRVFPTRNYVDYAYPGCRCPYPIALIRWRLSQHREYRHHSSRVLRLSEELAGGNETRSTHS